MSSQTPSLSNDFQETQTLPIVANWLAQIGDEARSETQEFAMYTDVHLISEVRGGCGPYSFLNAISRHDGLGKVQMGFFFRCDFHWNYPFHRGSVETDETNYHGGWLQDEASALASLVLGARVRAGDCVRVFNPQYRDPLGTPRASRSEPPQLAMRNHRLVIPSAIGQRNLGDLKMIQLLLKLTPKQSVALMRAARLYQDALWIGESEPELAWLMFVSAIETGALMWHKNDLEPIDVLKTAKNEFAIKLHAKGDDILALVAEEVAHLFKATAKFQKFCMCFLPEEPTTRPHANQQVEWTPANWKRILAKIYDYRSRALHSGVPFPYPMCEPPEMYGSDSIATEKGTGELAVRTLGASWNAGDVPVSLNTFAQLTRNILLAWWSDMAKGDPSGAAN